MAYVVLGLWVIQGAVGAVLAGRWRRGGSPAAGRVIAHISGAVLALALWIAFVVTGSLGAAWAAFAVITFANTIGDTMLVARSRRLHGTSEGGWRDYGRAIVDTFRRRLPAPVVVHALFSGVVYFTCLGVCIGATAAA